MLYLLLLGKEIRNVEIQERRCAGYMPGRYTHREPKLAMDAFENFKSSRRKLFDSEGIQPQSKFVSAKGPIENVHYLLSGRGEPLILIHGGGDHSSEWFNIIEPLSKHFRLYIVDRPGCGLSDSFDYHGEDLKENAIEFIRSFMDATGLKEAMIMGHSIGGYFSICFAMRHPERVKKLLLIGAPAGMRRWVPFMMRLMGTKGVNRILMNTVGKPSPENVKDFHEQLMVVNTADLSDEFFRHVYYNQLIPGNKRSFLSLMENALNLNGWKERLYIGDQLGRLKVPVRFVWGDKDAFEKPGNALPKVSAIKDCKFKTVKNAAHAPWLDRPEYCCQLITSLLQT